MADLTMTVDDEILRRARVRATEEGTSLNTILRDYLETYAAARQDCAQAAEAILRLSNRAQFGRGDARWTRDELHER